LSPSVVDPNLLPNKPKEALWIRYIKQRIRENKNFIGIISGPTGCLHENTKLLNNSKSLGELYTSGERFVNTISMTKSNYPVKSRSEIIDSGMKEVFEIELEDGKVVFATSEHLFFKKSFEEVKVENLKVGDNMKSYSVNKINNYWEKAKNKTIIQRKKVFRNQSYCKCGFPFYREFGHGNQSVCKTCCKEHCINLREGKWMLWEDQILRNYYFNSERKFIKDLLLNNRNWVSIRKRAGIVNLSRKDYFKHIETIRRNILDNVSKRPEVRLKKSQQMKEAIKKDKGKLLNRMMKRNKKTFIEMKVEKILLKNNISYKYNQKMNLGNSYKFPDFLVGNVVIECDGQYWHKDKLKEVKRDRLFIQNGYDILHFSGKKIRNNLEIVERCILSKVGIMK